MSPKINVATTGIAEKKRKYLENGNSTTIWLPIAVSLTCVYVLYTIKTINHGTSRFSDGSVLDFLVETQGCRIPYMDPLDKSISEFIMKPKKIKCNKGKPSLFSSNRTSVFLLNSSLSAYGIKNRDHLSCCYKTFWRRVPKLGEYDWKIRYSKQCVPFNNTATIKDEFIKLLCSYGNHTVYQDYFAFVPLKNNMSKQVKSLKSVDILIIGMDSVSRMNLHRQMPETVKILEHLGAVEFLGFNMIGDNTFMNLVPLLTGIGEKQLRDTMRGVRYDEAPLIWKEFKKQGYTTAFGEDSAWMGVFNFQRQGFKKQPTDYYWDHFNVEAEFSIGNNHKMNMYRCIGSRRVHEVFLDYIKNFVVTMQEAERRFFSFFWSSSLSHDYLNTPSNGDEDFKRFFENLNDNGYLENTAVVFLSDHGMRWGGIASTYQGIQEKKLPFLFILLPKWFKEAYPISYGNLEDNSKKLTTNFDVHSTLLSLLHANKLIPVAKTNITKRVNLSLFDEIPSERTCKDVWIPEKFCACKKYFIWDIF